MADEKLHKPNGEIPQILVERVELEREYERLLVRRNRDELVDEKENSHSAGSVTSEFDAAAGLFDL